MNEPTIGPRCLQALTIAAAASRLYVPNHRCGYERCLGTPVRRRQPQRGAPCGQAQPAALARRRDRAQDDPRRLRSRRGGRPVNLDAGAGEEGDVLFAERVSAVPCRRRQTHLAATGRRDS